MVGCIALPAIAAPSSDSTTSQSIRLLVDGKAPVVLDRASLSALPRASVTASAHHEPPSQWQGVALEDILRKANVPSGEQLRGKAMTTLVRITASDHYQVVFTLAELDPMLGNTQVILADTQDGHPLNKGGPFRLIVPGDKRPARWIRSVATIEVAQSAAPTP
ncbi:molybdopterin-dependent oxidoreductase [Dyella psychrodurans]|nr:molybdopterin-dependent oxidoreductase [Dyella psychrodurans]